MGPLSTTLLLWRCTGVSALGFDFHSYRGKTFTWFRLRARMQGAVPVGKGPAKCLAFFMPVTRLKTAPPESPWRGFFRVGESLAYAV